MESALAMIRVSAVVLLMLLMLLLVAQNALAEISISISPKSHHAKIHVRHETIASVLNYYQAHFGTTATLPASLAHKWIDADMEGTSLLMLTQRLLRGFNVGLIADDASSIRHISLLPKGKTGSVMQIGADNADVLRMHRQLRRIEPNSTAYSNGRRRIMSRHGLGRFYQEAPGAASGVLSIERKKAMVRGRMQVRHRWH